MKFDNSSVLRLAAPVLGSLILASCGTPPSTSSSSSSESSSNPSSSSSSSVSSVPSSSSSSSSEAPISAPLVLAINSGSTTSGTFNGVEYEADKYSRGGSTNSTTDSVSNANGSSVMQSERYGDYSYEIPVLEGTYSVEMHFVEMYHEDSGLRSFDISVENEQIETNLDLYATAGHDSLYTLTSSSLRVTDGTLNITLSANTDAGTIAGFAVYSADGGIDTSVPVSDCNGYVAVTFDDGPTSATPSFVQSLRDNNLVPVTFFVEGQKVNGTQPSVILDMASVGQVQNHAYSHSDGMNTWSYDMVLDELNRTNDAITNAGAPKPTLFRVPNIKEGGSLDQASTAAGLYRIPNSKQTITNDWSGQNGQQTVSQVASYGAGTIIGMHENQANTRSAIADIARVIKEKGLCPGLIDPNTGNVIPPQ